MVKLFVKTDIFVEWMNKTFSRSKMGYTLHSFCLRNVLIERFCEMGYVFFKILVCACLSRLKFVFARFESS